MITKPLSGFLGNLDFLCLKTPEGVSGYNPLVNGKQNDFLKLVMQHEAIITEDLYCTVQNVLDGRSRTYRPKMQIEGLFTLPKMPKNPYCQ